MVDCVASFDSGSIKGQGIRMLSYRQAALRWVWKAIGPLLLFVIAACDGPVTTERPIAFGESVKETEGVALGGDYTFTQDDKVSYFTLSWRGDTGLSYIQDRGSLRVQMRERLDGPLKFDVSLVLTGLPDAPGLYAASLIPDRSLVYETDGPRAGEFARFELPLMFVLHATGDQIEVWIASDTGTAGTRLLDELPPRQKRAIVGELVEDVFILSASTMQSALLANHARVRRGSSPALLRRVSSADSCRANWLDEANADGGRPGARARLADWYADSIASCPQNCGEAVNALALESVSGNLDARERLKSWQRSNTCQIATGNNPLLRNYLERARTGDVTAMFSLARMFEIDTGIVPVNFGEAIKWYLAAAAGGDGEAQFTVGKMYHYGVGEPGGPSLVSRDAAMAKYWYDQAASSGHAGASAARASVAARPADRDSTAENFLTAAGALAISYCVANPEDCFGGGGTGASHTQTEPSGSANVCAVRIASDLMRCRSHIDYASCHSGGCNDVWQCDRVSRHISNGKVSYYTRNTDIRSLGKCRRPGSSGRTDEALYCDRATGKRATTYEALIAAACR